LATGRLKKKRNLELVRDLLLKIEKEQQGNPIQTLQIKEKEYSRQEICEGITHRGYKENV
jgi:hypothetical protein